MQFLRSNHGNNVSKGAHMSLCIWIYGKHLDIHQMAINEGLIALLHARLCEYVLDWTAY